MPDLRGTGWEPSHHIVLYDGTTEIGFVVSDQGGNPDERTFRRFPFADPQQPYVTEKQASFGGGFGQHKFEDNRAAYWLGEGVDTTKDVMVLDPAFRYGKGGFENAYNFLSAADGKYSHAEILNADRYIATRFSPTKSMSGGTTAIKFFLGKTGTPPAVLTVELRSDSSGDPGSVLASATVAASEAVEEDGQWYKLALTYGSTLTAGTNYWICWQSSGGSDSNHWHILRSDTVYTSSKHSTNGTSWATHEGDHYFRLEGVNTAAHYRFYEYKGQMYFIQSKDSTGSDTMWMNGWRGACDSNSGQLDNLKDSSNSDWASKITGDEVVEITAGPASGEQDDFRVVNGDSLGELANGTLPVTPDWIVQHTTNDDYIVYNSDWFQEINAQAPGWSLRKVTDIAVTNGIAFFSRNSEHHIVTHREYNSGGSWVNDSLTDTWGSIHVTGDKMQVQPDPVNGDILWVGTNASEGNDYRPEITKVPIWGWDQLSASAAMVTKNKKDLWTSNSVHINKVGGYNDVGFFVYVGKVDTVSINDGGSGYTNGTQTLTLVQNDSSGTATVSVEVVGGVVTSINSVTAEGYDYTTGVKQTTGGGGTGAEITVTNVTGFTNGLMAYCDIKDFDGNAQTVDIRFCTKFRVGRTVIYKTILSGENQSIQQLDSGDLYWSVDDATGCASPFMNLSFPVLRDGEFFGGGGMDAPDKYLDAPSNLSTLDGAQAAASTGLILNQTQTKSFSIRIYNSSIGYNDVEPVEIGVRDGDDITGMNMYGDPEELWVFTESGMGSVINHRYKPVPIRELKIAHHPNNGKANEVSDVYLLFSWKGRLQRYFRQNLEDLGPEFPAGLSDIAGSVVSVVTYPGRIYAAVDGGENGKSLILCHKGGAWHEVYTSFTGERIRELYIQAVPEKSDKLWASVGTGVMWWPISLNAAELEANSDYRYRPEGHLITSWVYTGDMELNKLFRSIVVVGDNFTVGNEVFIQIEYQIDDPDSSWVELQTPTTLSNSALEYSFSDGSAGQSITGNRVRLRISIHTHDATSSPTIRSIQYRIYRLPEIKYAWSWLGLTSNISYTVQGDTDLVLGTQATIDAALSQLDTWAANMTPLTVDTDIDAFNGRTVLMEPIPFQLITLDTDDEIEEDIVQVTVNDI